MRYLLLKILCAAGLGGFLPVLSQAQSPAPELAAPLTGAGVSNSTMWAPLSGSSSVAGPLGSSASGAAVGNATESVIPSRRGASAANATRPQASQADGKQSATPGAAKPNDGGKSADTKAMGDMQIRDEPVRALAEVEFQRFVKQSTGQSLKLFGFDLFKRNTFSPVQAENVPSGYTLGPGDELLISVYGMLDISERFTIDREGRIALPKAGPLSLAGVSFSSAEKAITDHLSKVFTNFKVSVTMGRLRSIEIFVLGQTDAPGKYYLSSLSSFVSAVYQTGGPNSNGSLRAIELRRDGRKIATVDLYALLTRGDMSADVKLLNGDMIFIPPAGPRAALLGTVNDPAIYELRAGETIQDVLNFSGGLPFLATPQKAQLERLNANREVPRYVEDFALDKTGLDRTLQAGDMLTVFQISPQIANVVTLQGNVAEPMRYSFKKGMKISDLLFDERLLIPGSYWLQLNAGLTSTNYSRPEVNLDYAVISRLDIGSLRTKLIAFNLRRAIAKDPIDDLLLESGDIVTIFKPGEAGPETLNSVTVTGEIVGGVQRFAWHPGFRIADIIPSTQFLIDYYNYWQRKSGSSLKDDINWNYAQIIRRDPKTLTSRAIVFNLGNAVLRSTPNDNLVIAPGDQISLFTSGQVAVPAAAKVRLVSLAGEVAVPGIYQANPGETLPQLLRRAGGLTPQAYLFGSVFTRESVRLAQQSNLEKLITRLQDQARAQASRNEAGKFGTDAAQAAAVLEQQRLRTQGQIDRLREVKSNGRIALELDTRASDIAALPPLELEDGDKFTVPVLSNFVAALGSVNNENVFIYRPGKTVADVVKSAGLMEDAEFGQSFVLRADGSIVAKSSNGGFFGSGFESLELMPGDTLVVPAQVDRETRYNAIVRVAKDWTQILSNFGIGAAALKSLGY